MTHYWLLQKKLFKNKKEFSLKNACTPSRVLSKEFIFKKKSFLFVKDFL
jgi:hypothetical protein